MSSPLNPQERLDWLRLIRTDNVGPLTFYSLMRHYGSAARALDVLPDLARRGGRTGLKPYPRAAAERELAAIAEAGGALIAWGEEDYPPLLAELDDAPPLIIVLGDRQLLRRRAVGIVGARNASAAGLRFARELAWELGQRGFVVVSGLARGIDAAAHTGALDGGTIGVVGGGADVVYPEENRHLFEALTARGAILAESPLGTEPAARLFPRRNRLISGMSAGIVVVEAALKSGSLITARLAADQGREVFAVPGSPLDPRCRGTNDLIRNGATLTESVEDVIAVLGSPTVTRIAEDRRRYVHPAPAPETDDGELAEIRRRLGTLLGPTPVAIDDLVRLIGVGPSLVSFALLEMELTGELTRHAGNKVSVG